MSWLSLQPCGVLRVQAISPIIQDDRYNWKNPGQSSWALERQHSLQPDSCGGRRYSEARMIFSEEAGSKVLLGIWLFPLPTPHAWFLSLETSLEVEALRAGCLWEMADSHTSHAVHWYKFCASTWGGQCSWAGAVAAEHKADRTEGFLSTTGAALAVPLALAGLSGCNPVQSLAAAVVSLCLVCQADPVCRGSSVLLFLWLY